MRAFIHSCQVASALRGVGPALLLCGALWGCTPAITYDYSQEPDPWKSGKYEYVLGPSDTIKVNVWKNAEISTDAIVRPDGTVTLPLVGDIQADGRTTKQLRDEIARRLSTYLKSEDTPVTVALTSVSSYRFTVSGNVEHAGIYSPKYYVRVSEALAMAGGLNKFGSGDKIAILRNTDGKMRRIPIIYSMLSTHPEMDIAVMRGDTLLVP